MNRVYQLPDQDKVYDEASLWISKLDKGLSNDELQNLKQWLAKSEEHRKVMFRMAGLWDKMDSLSRLSDLLPQPQQPRFAKWKPALAACLLAIVLLELVRTSFYMSDYWPENINYGWSQPSEKHSVTYETAIGQKSTVNLPDGSQVILNTNSLIGLRYSSKERAIDLLRGEAHFKVAHDRARPLTVYFGGQAVRAVGTAFNIQKLESGLVKVIVTEGKVAVADELTPDRLAPNTSSSSQKKSKLELITVSGSEKIILGSATREVQQLEPEDIHVALSWQQGNLIFRGETLEFAIEEITRYVPLKIEIVNEDVKQVRIAGVFVAGDVNGLLAMLKENFNINSQRIGNDQILIGVNAG